MELSVKVMCCLPLEKLGERQRKKEERIFTVENTLCTIDTYSTFPPEITNDNFEGGKIDARVYKLSLDSNITRMI